MQQYDYMLGELKKLRNKITNKELNKSFLLWKLYGTGAFIRNWVMKPTSWTIPLKKRGQNTKESIMYCLSTIFSGGVALLVCDCPIF